MKFERIVGFGDSWIWGDELLDPELSQLHPGIHVSDPRNQAYRENHCFLGQLARHFDVPAENFGWPGGSLKSTIWTYLWWLENSGQDVKNSLVLIGLTNSYRHSFYNPTHRSQDNFDPPWNRFVHDQWIRSAPHLFADPWQQLAKLNIALTQDEVSLRRQYQEAAWFFHGQHLAFKENIILQFNIVDPPCYLGLSSFVLGESSLENYLKRFTDVTAPGNHPNLAGHDLISKKLIDEIYDVIMT